MIPEIRVSTMTNRMISVDEKVRETIIRICSCGYSAPCPAKRYDLANKTIEIAVQVGRECLHDLHYPGKCD